MLPFLTINIFLFISLPLLTKKNPLETNMTRAKYCFFYSWESLFLSQLILVMFELCESLKKLIEGTLPVSFILKDDFLGAQQMTQSELNTQNTCKHARHGGVS